MKKMDICATKKPITVLRRLLAFAFQCGAAAFLLRQAKCSEIVSLEEEITRRFGEDTLLFLRKNHKTKILTGIQRHCLLPDNSLKNLYEEHYLSSQGTHNAEYGFQI